MANNNQPPRQTIGHFDDDDELRRLPIEYALWNINDMSSSTATEENMLNDPIGSNFGQDEEMNNLVDMANRLEICKCFAYTINVKFKIHKILSFSCPKM